MKNILGYFGWIVFCRGNTDRTSCCRVHWAGPTKILDTFVWLDAQHFVFYPQALIHYIYIQIAPTFVWNIFSRAINIWPIAFLKFSTHHGSHPWGQKDVGFDKLFVRKSRQSNGASQWKLLSLLCPEIRILCLNNQVNDFAKFFIAQVYYLACFHTFFEP